MPHTADVGEAHHLRRRACGFGDDVLRYATLFAAAGMSDCEYRLRAHG